MRGRLIFPFQIRLAQLSTELTEGEGYDHVFREAVQLDNGTEGGTDARQETTLYVRAQVEPLTFDRLHKYASGDSREAAVTLVCHYAELEDAGLVGSAGDVMIRVNDRLEAICEDTPEKAVVLNVPARPGLYLYQVQPMGFGYGGKRNLLLLEFRARPQAG